MSKTSWQKILQWRRHLDQLKDLGNQKENYLFNISRKRLVEIKKQTLQEHLKDFPERAFNTQPIGYWQDKSFANKRYEYPSSCYTTENQISCYTFLLRRTPDKNSA
ncbi:unnamed protein product (macronuclear) [Paramecium tetraurelia]|uniref:Uncharacterized protein n=1 Tax=Paramecium tetraurelia TaxID=5888 RepID=A0DK32_PARTE|nr:uncharacterized protein GSPATT00039549001 [Paramecium tetraurelia]CAK83399.1 unnamed protein product [Paramecium tetraurelia]|eukprot:XP_001450796.1 hypothetical protein (macronuclear) [Paramecium tetraurelia strain d4-2]